MAIKLEMLHTFRVVAEQGALSAAAAILGRSPSAVSMTLSQLQDHIGAPLFETDRKNRLTKLGALVLVEAVRATDAFDSSTNAIHRLNSFVDGTVRIAAVPTVVATLLPKVIQSFRQAYPSVRIEISDLDTASVRRRVVLDQADIGVITAARSDHKTYVPLAHDPLGIVYRKGHPIDQALLHGTHTPSWALLALEPLIDNPLCAHVDNSLVKELRDGCALQAHNTTALLSFVRTGLGATILPSTAVSILGEGLGFVAPTDPILHRDLCVIHSPDRRLGPAAMAFRSALCSV